MIQSPQRRRKRGVNMAQSIYFGGPILTMEEPLYAQALVDEDGVISALRHFELL